MLPHLPLKLIMFVNVIFVDVMFMKFTKLTCSFNGCSTLHLFLFYRGRKYIAYCTSGYRSVIASSILRAEGFDVVDVYGGFAAVSVYAPQITTTGKVSVPQIIIASS